MFEKGLLKVIFISELKQKESLGVQKEKCWQIKPNRKSIMGGVVDKIQGKNQSNFAFPNFTPAFTLPLSVKSII